MSSSVKVMSTVGVDKDDLFYGAFRKWLTPIRVSAVVHKDLSQEPKEVGEAFGFVIRRQSIRQSFHKSMEPPSSDMMKLALELFDRYGSLKEEIIEHSIRKGSGVWKDELNEGNFVLIETVKVKKRWRKKGVGKKLVLKLLEEAMALRRNVMFAFAWPTVLNDRADDHGKQKQTKEQRRAYERAEQAIAIRFFRTLHFRRVGFTEWFALARDKEHSSRALRADEDRDPIEDDMSDSECNEEDEEIVFQMPMNLGRSGVQVFPSISTKRDITSCFSENSRAQDEGSCTAAKIPSRRNPLHYAIKNWADAAGLEFLQSHTEQGSSEPLDVEAVNGHGDTILHVAACASKLASLDWIVKSLKGAKLAGMRNHEGYTPLEALEAKLESERIGTAWGLQRTILKSDKFEGFDDNSVACLLKLRGVEIITAEKQERARFGCSCGQCVAGFLSPRMARKLLNEVQMIDEYLHHLCSIDDGETWYLDFKEYLRHLPDRVQPHFRHNFVLRKAFTTLIGTVAKCLADGIIPNKVNVTNGLKETSIWSQIDRHYFQRGGTVAAVVNLIIDEAKEHDIKAGEPLYELEQNEDLERFSKCRNDYEFEFVRCHCVDDAPLKTDQKTDFP
jgi:GNAT superfamily N-acetyltransferase